MEDRAFDGIAGVGAAAAGGTGGEHAHGPAKHRVLEQSLGQLSRRVAASLGKRLAFAPQGAVAGTVFQTMGDNMVLTDGTRSVELYQMVGNAHHDGLIMAYLRKEKLLIEADAYTPGAVPKTPDPFSVNLEANVRRLSIDVERILPLHGAIVPYGNLLEAIGKKPAPKKE